MEIYRVRFHSERPRVCDRVLLVSIRSLFLCHLARWSVLCVCVLTPSVALMTELFRSSDWLLLLLLFSEFAMPWLLLWLLEIFSSSSLFHSSSLSCSFFFSLRM